MNDYDTLKEMLISSGNNSFVESKDKNTGQRYIIMINPLDGKTEEILFRFSPDGRMEYLYPRRSNR